MLFHNFTAEELSVAQRTLKRNGKILFNNLPVLHDVSLYQISKTDDSLLIRKREHNFYRLFVCSNNDADIKKSLNSLYDDIYLLNIPTKEDIMESKSLLYDCGFELCGVYKRFYNKSIVHRDEVCGAFAHPDDFDDIKAMLYETFSTYTDYIPEDEELLSMISNRQVLVNRYENGRVGGFVIFTIEAARGYINVWLDKTGNGIPLMNKTYNVFEENGVKYVNFWINSQNRNVIVLHRMMGAKSDGLIDYTFLKNK